MRSNKQRCRLIVKQLITANNEEIKMKILVVDDSKTMRMIIIRTLKQAGFDGHTILQASDGAEAFSMIEKEEPKLVLTDWNMPEMNGLELVAKVREAGIPLRIGFVTTECTDTARAEAEEVGASFFITKPFTPETFAAELGELIG